MNPNLYGANPICDCGRRNPCPVTPIVCPPRVCCVHRCFCVEQPVIVPIHTRILNHYVPRPRYYPQYSCSEENICHTQPHQQQTGYDNL